MKPKAVETKKKSRTNPNPHPATRKSRRKLLLFDIDGTLLDTGGAGLECLQAGFFEAFPEQRSRPFPPLDLGGATDSGIAMFLFEYFGLPDLPEHRKRFFHCYSGHLTGKLAHYSGEGRGGLLPGVVELLDFLKDRGEHELALLTGNIREGARIKLCHFRIDHYFSTGAFGDDHHDRNKLGPIAHERAAESCGEAFPPAQIAVIGDTPKDIACARALGALAVAVATGTVGKSELEAASPDILLDDLSNPDRVMNVIASAFSRRVDG